mmetsp:Transcript_25190/g.39288  ORF Transcript_25190/g.39288 Transcript_25190/m.39288 type:complete len:462 (-) Transcript_25190:57-1442(-)
MNRAPFASTEEIQTGQPIDETNKLGKPADEAIREDRRPYNDVWAAVAWIASVIVVLVFGIKGYHDPRTLGTVAEEDKIVLPSLRRLFLILLTSSASSFFTSMGLVALTQKHARQVIYASNGFLLGMYLAGMITSFTSGGHCGGGWFCLIAFVVHLIFLTIFRSRIPFAALCLKTSAGLVQRYRGMINTAFAFAVLEVVFLTIWGNGLVNWTNTNVDECTVEVQHSMFWLWIFFLFWGLQVLNGIVHATTCGVVAMHFFCGGATPRNPSVGALRRACSFSLGSICLGSLIVAILKTLCAFLRMLTRSGDNHNFLRAVARVLVNAIESLMEYFNAYAFVHIAIFGGSYVASAKATWRLVKTSAIQAIVNDDFTNTLCFLHILLCTLLSTILCGVLFHMPGQEHGWAIPSTIAAIVAFFVSRTVFQVLSSGVMAIFVCYAEKPEVLRRVNPAFAHQMEEATRNY